MAWYDRRLSDLGGRLPAVLTTPPEPTSARAAMGTRPANSAVASPNESAQPALVASAVTAEAATAAQSVGKLAAGLVGEHPSEILANPRLRAEIETVIPSEARTGFMEGLGVASGVVLKDGYIVGRGCVPHLCGERESIILIQEGGNRIFAATLADNKVSVHGVLRDEDPPSALKSWVDEKRASPTPVAQATVPTKAPQAPDVEDAQLPLAGGSVFGPSWYWWLIAGVILTIQAPLAMIRTDHTSEIDTYAGRLLINKMLQKRQYDPVGTGLEAVGSYLIVMLIFLVIGPLIVWWSIGKPIMHKMDSSGSTLCCIEEPQVSADRRLIYDLYRDDSNYFWALFKAIVLGDNKDEWKLRIIDVKAQQFLNLSAAGDTEDGGRVLRMGKQKESLVLTVAGPNLIMEPNRSPESRERPAAVVAAASFGLKAWPHLEQSKQNVGSRCAEHLSNDPESGKGGLLHSVYSLLRVVASWKSYDCTNPEPSRPARKITLFDVDSTYFSTYDGKVQVFKAGGNRLKFVEP